MRFLPVTGRNRRLYQGGQLVVPGPQRGTAGHTSRFVPQQTCLRGVAAAGCLRTGDTVVSHQSVPLLAQV